MPVTMTNMAGKLAKYFNDMQDGLDGKKVSADNFTPVRIIERDGAPEKVQFMAMAPDSHDNWYPTITMVCEDGDIPATVKGRHKSAVAAEDDGGDDG